MNNEKDLDRIKLLTRLKNWYIKTVTFPTRTLYLLCGDRFIEDGENQENKQTGNYYYFQYALLSISTIASTGFKCNIVEERRDKKKKKTVIFKENGDIVELGFQLDETIETELRCPWDLKDSYFTKRNLTSQTIAALKDSIKYNASEGLSMYKSYILDF